MKITNPKTGELIATATHNLIEFEIKGTRIVVAGGDYVTTIKYPEVGDKCVITVAGGKMQVEQPEYQVEDKEEENGEKEDEENGDGGEPKNGGDEGEPEDDSEGKPEGDDSEGGDENGDEGGDGSGEDGDKDEGSAEKKESRKYTSVK